MSNAWWSVKRETLLALMEARASAYVYDLETVAARCAELKALSAVDRVWYAIKANAHPELLRAVVDAGLGLECVSVEELRHARAALPNGGAGNLLFTPNFAARAEYQEALDIGAQITLDGLYPLEAWPEMWRGVEVIARFNPDRPRGHHRHVHTAGPRAKFGVPISDADQFAALADKAGAHVTGLHAHAGSGVDDPSHWREIGMVLGGLRDKFPDADMFNLGGGLGVPATAEAPRLDFEAFNASLEALKLDTPGIKLWLEPGRYVAAEAGVLLSRVTQVKTAHGARFIGIATGMNSLIRPALYNAVHEIVNLSRIDAEAEGLASVVGPICESADALGVDRLLPRAEEGDVMLIANAGAYGHTMSSHYNMRAPAEEIILEPS